MKTKAEKTKSYIIEKVGPLFNRNGYAGTSIQEITAVTGLSKGSVYGNFKDKDALAIEVFRHNFAKLTIPIREEVSKHHKAIDKLMGFLKFYKKNYHEIFANGGCTILNTATEVDDTHPQLKKEVVKAINGWKRFLEDILEEGIRSNELKKMDCESFSIYMMTTIEGAILLAKTTGQYKYLKYSFNDLAQRIRALEV